jgi:LPXTG-motif cell wall-anchored protein
MRAGLESKMIRRVLGALLLTGVLLVAGATAASADGYGDCSGCPPTSTPPTSTPPVHTPPAPHYGPTYPVPSVPPQAPPGTPTNPPPTLPRTGSDTGMLLGIGAGAVLVGGGLVVLARKRRLAVVPA